MSKPKRSQEMQATQKMLYHVRDELKSDVASLRCEMKSEFANVRAEMSGMKSEISGMKSEISGMKSEISGVKSEILAMSSDLQENNAKFHRMLTLYEEQEHRNRYVLDGYQSLYDRQARLESKK